MMALLDGVDRFREYSCKRSSKQPSTSVTCFYHHFAMRDDAASRCPSAYFTRIGEACFFCGHSERVLVCSTCSIAHRYHDEVGIPLPQPSIPLANYYLVSFPLTREQPDGRPTFLVPTATTRRHNRVYFKHTYTHLWPLQYLVLSLQ